MLRRGLLVTSILLTGSAACTNAPEVGVVTVRDALTSDNGLSSNGLSLNGLSSNGLSSNGLSSNGLSSNGLMASAAVMSALRDTTATGDLTRTFFAYLISCALPSGHSTSYTWTDTTGMVHTEVNLGALGLAPGWENGAATQTQKELVSACLGARTNSLGVHVPLSMRAKGVSALNVTSAERSSYTFGEGAFWGNLFNGGSPYLYSCSRNAFATGPSTSQYTQQGRTCTTSACGIITPVGPCYTANVTTGQACYEQNSDWTANCSPQMSKAVQGSQNVIATWLMP
jgi:hypothetical protein